MNELESKHIGEQEKSQEVLDEYWFEEVDKIKETNVIYCFNTDSNDVESKAERQSLVDKTVAAIYTDNELFFYSDDFKPHYLRVEKNNQGFYIENIQKLKQIKTDLNTNEKNEYVKKIYNSCIDEKILYQEMAQATWQKDDKIFTNIVKEIYKDADKELFDLSRMYTVDFLKDLSNFENKKVKEIYDTLYREITNNFEQKPIKPLTKMYSNVTDLKLIGQKTAEYAAFAPVQSCAATKEIYQSPALVKMVTQRLKDISAIDQSENVNNWKIDIAQNNLFSASHNRRTVSVPKTRVINFTKTEGLLRHEIETHVQRGKQGEISQLKLLKYGLASYEVAEEGLSTFFEQLITGDDKLARFDRYLAIGLVTGLDGKKRNFPELAKIMKNYYFLQTIKNRELTSKDLDNQDTFNEIMMHAAKESWTTCFRTFRGTYNWLNHEGNCCIKDKIYFEGNKQIYDLVDKIKKYYTIRDDNGLVKTDTKKIELIFNMFKIGKWNPMIPEHYDIIAQFTKIKNDHVKIKLLYEVKALIEQ